MKKNNRITSTYRKCYFFPLIFNLLLIIVQPKIHVGLAKCGWEIKKIALKFELTLNYR